jgi:hypothetical protein
MDEDYARIMAGNNHILTDPDTRRDGYVDGFVTKPFCLTLRLILWKEGISYVVYFVGGSSLASRVVPAF